MNKKFRVFSIYFIFLQLQFYYFFKRQSKQVLSAFVLFMFLLNLSKISAQACNGTQFVTLDQTTVITGVVDFTEPTSGNTIIVKGVLNVHSLLSIFFGGNLIVESGGTLNLLNSGHITFCGVGFWPGIRAEENSTININGGTISQSLVAIKAFRPASLNINYANFFDNYTDIELTGPIQNASFSNSYFGAFENGVIIHSDRVDPFVFNNCTFTGQSGSGIITNYGASVDVKNNCHFVGSNHGISLANVFSKSGQNSIDGNQFYNCNNGIYSVNSSSFIKNNHFSGNDYGIVFRGLNLFESNNNNFMGSGYAELIDGTNNVNQSYLNDYSTDVGIYPHNSNDYYTFTNNCFNTRWWDVDAHGTLPDQFKDVDVAAGNCFTGPNEFECYTNDILYGVPKGNSYSLCFKPNDANFSFKNFEVDNANVQSECGAGVSTDNQYSYLIRMGCNLQRLQKSIDSLQTIVNTLKSLPHTSNSFVNRMRLSIAQRHLFFAINQLGICLRREKKFKELKEWYIKWSKEFPTNKYFALEVAAASTNMRNYSIAKLEIDSIALKYNMHIDITKSIKMSIDVIELEGLKYDEVEIHNNDGLNFNLEQDYTDYNLTTEGIQLLRRVAQMTVPEAAYGRALLTYLTGEMLYPNDSRPIALRKKHDLGTEESINEQYSMYPNPSSDYVTIELSNSDPRAQYRYDILDMIGQKVDTGDLTVEAKLSTSGRASGVYALRILKNGVPVHIKKLIIQK